MWLILGVGAIITGILNLIWSMRNQNAKWFRFISLSLTALTICAFYSNNVQWVKDGDLSALRDVVPTMSIVLWILTIVSITINSISLFKENKNSTK